LKKGKVGRHLSSASLRRDLGEKVSSSVRHGQAREIRGTAAKPEQSDIPP